MVLPAIRQSLQSLRVTAAPSPHSRVKPRSVTKAQPGPISTRLRSVGAQTVPPSTGAGGQK